MSYLQMFLLWLGCSSYNALGGCGDITLAHALNRAYWIIVWTAPAVLAWHYAVKAWRRRKG